MKAMRWRAFGHILRLDPQAPCQLAMVYYFDQPENAKKYPGRRRTNLPTTINEDIKESAKTNVLPVSQFESLNDLLTLRRVASDRSEWRSISTMICDIAEGDE